MIGEPHKRKAVPPREVGKVFTLGNFTASATIGASALVTDARTIEINQTTTGVTLTLPSPADTSVVFGLDVVNIGSVAFTMGNVVVSPMSVARYEWTGTGGSWVVDAATFLSNTTQSSQNAGPLAGMRNKIVNGSFWINQRVYVTATALAAGAYGHDRWKAGSGGGTYSFTQGAVDTQINITAGTMLQVVEGLNLDLAAGVVSWTGTATCRIYQGTASSQTSPAYSVGTSTSILGVATNYLAFSGLTPGTSVSVEFGTGTVGTVQMESGSIPTVFERIPLATSMTLCQRYFFQTTGAANAVLGVSGYSGIASELQYFTISLPGTMRIAPTVTLIGTYSSVNFGAPSIAASTGTFVIRISGTAVGQSSLSNPASGGYSANAEL